MDEDAVHQSPLLIWDDHHRHGRRVVACCPRARAVGVQTGMPIAQATQWCLSKTTQIHEVSSPNPPESDRHDSPLDHEILQHVVERFQNHLTPMVALESLDKQPWAGHPRHQCESLICDITGVAHLFGGETGILRAASDLLASMNLAGCLAIADHLGVAWAVAHEGTRAVAHDALSRRLTPPDQALPPRCAIVPTGESQHYLEPLPLRALRIDEATLKTLGRLGIKTVGELLQLPLSGLASRLGTPLVCRIQQALGEREDPLDVHHVETEHCETWSLQYPTRDLPILVDRIGQLCQKLKAGMATRQRGALRMTCRLDLAAHPPLSFKVGLFAPTTDADHLCGLISQKLERCCLSSDVAKITLDVTLTGVLRTTQRSLVDSQGAIFDELRQTSMAGSSISRLVDSLSGRLGRDHVVEVRLQPNPLPENAYRIIPLAGNDPAIRAHRRSLRSLSKHSPSKRSPSAQTIRASDAHARNIGFSSSLFVPSKGDAMRRPLSLLRSPISLKVSSGNSSFDSVVSSPELPKQLLIHGVVHRVVKHWGPERIETNWWNGPTIRRDYYRIETDRKHWWWIYCNLAFRDHYQWVLHGRFS